MQGPSQGLHLSPIDRRRVIAVGRAFSGDPAPVILLG